MNLNKLKGKIVENGFTQQKLADKMGLTIQSVNAKLNNRRPFTIQEACLITQILQLDNPIEIFFTQSIPEMQRKKN